MVDDYFQVRSLASDPLYIYGCGVKSIEDGSTILNLALTGVVRDTGQDLTLPFFAQFLNTLNLAMAFTTYPVLGAEFEPGK